MPHELQPPIGISIPALLATRSTSYELLINEDLPGGTKHSMLCNLVTIASLHSVFVRTFQHLFFSSIDGTIGIILILSQKVWFSFYYD